MPKGIRWTQKTILYYPNLEALWPHPWNYTGNWGLQLCCFRNSVSKTPWDGKTVLHPVAFLSEKMSPTECNYGIGDKELLAIVVWLEKWHIYLHSLKSPFVIFTDHHHLQNFMTKSLLNRRQARWAGLFAQYHFLITFRPGNKNGKADALTRWSGDLLKEGDDCAGPFQAMLPAKKFLNPVLCHTAVKHTPDICTALKSDSLAQEIMTALQNGSKWHPKVPVGECTTENDVIYVYGLLYILDNESLYREIIHAHNNHPATGHPGQAATYELVSCNYWWPGLRKTIAHYLANCNTCARIKPAWYAPFGLL